MANIRTKVIASGKFVYPVDKHAFIALVDFLESGEDFSLLFRRKTRPAKTTLIDASDFRWIVATDHHERRNGTGYSRGIEQQDLVVEVTTVCDIYDALVAQRPYRPVSYDNRTALEELTWMAQRGEISWEPVQVLVAYNRKNSRKETAAIRISMERRGKPPTENVYGILVDEESETSPGAGSSVSRTTRAVSRGSWQAGQPTE